MVSYHWERNNTRDVGWGDIISIKVKILRRQKRIFTLKLLSAVRNLFLAKVKMFNMDGKYIYFWPTEKTEIKQSLKFFTL